MNIEYYEQKTKRLYEALEKAEAEVEQLRDCAQAVFGTDLTSANKLIETNKGLGAELANLHERYLQVMQENKMLKKAESDLVELRDAVARCFDCESFRGGQTAWEQLRKLIGGKNAY